MKFSINRQSILNKLQSITSIIEQKTALPVLGNMLFEADHDSLTLTGTNNEVELKCVITEINILATGRITVPAKKLSDICKSLREDAEIEFELINNQLCIKSQNSSFTLSTIPADLFPNTPENKDHTAVSVERGALVRMLNKTRSSMAKSDVRTYLNGLLIDCDKKSMKLVGTDGHRLAISGTKLQSALSTPMQAILPRRSVNLFSKLLEGSDAEMTELKISANAIRVRVDNFQFTSRLIDGRFPNYKQVIPKNGDKVLSGDRDALREVFKRASILSQEKVGGVLLGIDKRSMTVNANNQAHEEAEEIVDVEFDGVDTLEIGFNAQYLCDVLTNLSGNKVDFTFTDASSSAVVTSANDEDSLFVLMPMKI